MKIINIIGGIGNQMFQYAFALAIKRKYPNEDVKIDVSHFSGYTLHNGFEIERNFGLLLPIANGRELRSLTYFAPNYKVSRIMRKMFGYKKTEYKEPVLFSYWPEVFEREGSCYFEGSWQNEKYFADYSDVIRQAFTFRQPLGMENEFLQDKILATNSVGVHVRRGDYLKDPAYQGICDLPYYKNAIAYIYNYVTDPHFFIFSNDAKWCEENIAPLCGIYTIVDWNGGKMSWADMFLMSKCKHNIIAHSSFSWWAAWLNSEPTKIIISPKGWFNGTNITESPQLEDWVKLENK